MTAAPSPSPSCPLPRPSNTMYRRATSSSNWAVLRNEPKSNPSARSAAWSSTSRAFPLVVADVDGREGDEEEEVEEEEVVERSLATSGSKISTFVAK